MQKEFDLPHALDARALKICFNHFGQNKPIPVKVWLLNLPEVIASYKEDLIFPEEYLNVSIYLNNKIEYLEDNLIFSKYEANKIVLDCFLETVNALSSDDNTSRKSILDFSCRIIPNSSVVLDSFLMIRTVQDLKNPILLKNIFDKIYKEELLFEEVG